MKELIGQALLACIRKMPPGQRMNIRAGLGAVVWVDCFTPDTDILAALRQLSKLDELQHTKPSKNNP